jgi:predicted Ser/Thr protein kinase
VTKDATDPELSTIGEHYVVDRELGRGGMATVYLCTDTRDGSRVAVKVLRQELGSAVVIERFLREIAYASEIDHPRIPKVLDSGMVGGLPYYAMTYVEGESLRNRLEREKQLSIEDAVRIACEAISATSYAHKLGIVHRDIKPENILLSESGVFVLDFGIARAIVESGADRLTSTGIGVGTPAYMSPEQALGDRNLDARSDIYSLGCVLYEMIAGIPPFVGPTAQVIISRRFAASAPPLREVRDGVPNWLEGAIARALAKAPTDRWKTADDFAKSLTVPGGGSAQIAGPRPALWRRPMTRIVVAGVALAVVAAALVAWSAGRRGSFANAQNALRAWDFPTAENELRRVVDANATDPVPQLALAQLLMLKGEPETQWKPYVLYAADHRAQLPAADQKRVDALAAFADKRLGDACQQFENAEKLDRARDPADYVSTLALADCLRQDPGVVPDKTSPSGYRFRASYQRSDSLYEALLDRHSGNAAAYAVLMPRLKKVLSIDKRTLRGGVLSGATPTKFYAAPSLVADTLGYIPYAYSPSTGPWRTLDPPQGLAAAASRNGQRLRAPALEWIRIAPNDPSAHETLAGILEMTGELSGNDVSALQQIGIARKLAADAGRAAGPPYLRQVRLASGEVGLYIRLTQFDRAAALADTILGWPRERQTDSAVQDSISRMLTNLAALRGQPSRVEEIEERDAVHSQVTLATGEVVTLPPALGRDESALSRYAEFGGSGDSVLTIAARLATNVNALVPAGQAEALRIAILRRPLTIAASVVGPEHAAELGPTSDLYVNALSATARGDKRAARSLLDSLAKFRAPNAPSEITMDAVFGEAWLRAALGDTVGATRQLDNALRGLPAATSSALRRSALTTSLVRVMALRAELAGHANQPEVAKRWADAVFELWGRGDPIVASTLDSVRRLR